MLRLVDKHWGGGGRGRFNNLTLGLMFILRFIPHVFVGIFIVILTTLRNASLITPLSKRYVIVEQPHIV